MPLDLIKMMKILKKADKFVLLEDRNYIGSIIKFKKKKKFFFSIDLTE